MATPSGVKCSVGQKQLLFSFQKLPATEGAPTDAAPGDAPATEAPVAEVAPAEEAPIDETVAA